MVDTENEQEVWKVYPEYPFIEASNFGRIGTRDRWVTYEDGRKRFVKSHILKPYDIGHGYMQVQISVNGKKVRRYVHRLVAVCFLPNHHNYPEINHKDNNPKNNAVSNLEWCTHEYNMAYKGKHGVSAAKAKGQPVIAVNRDTFEVFWFESQREAARQLGANRGSVNNVVKGKRNQTHGYYFCNADEDAIEKIKTKFGDEVAEKVEKLIIENQKNF